MFLLPLLLIMHFYYAAASSVPQIDDQEYLPITNIGQRAAQVIKNRLLRRNERTKSRGREICYDTVGCFPMPRAQVSPLKKAPQPPEEVDTKFILLTRNNSNSEEQLKYGDSRSFIESSFNPKLSCKIVVHGFKGSGKDKGALDIASTFLSLENTNIILVDWQKGAAGPSYVAAASNTQLIGRQVALLILDLISMGCKSSEVHIIGFSLGAHIAGYAGRALQTRDIKIGRITGLDPASILFRELLATSLSPLSKNDADYVDVIHTDGTKFLTEGLGLFKPIGHTDFFPNGGINQPGCHHVRGSVIKSHFGGKLNVSLVCNHIRAWQLYLESLDQNKTGCDFISFPCPEGWASFRRGVCFPTQCTPETCTKMGYSSNVNKVLGPLYLITRDSPPFCGYQLKATVILSKSVLKSKGYMQLSIFTESEHINFQLYSEYRDELQAGYSFHGLAAAKYGSISPSITKILTVQVSCNRVTLAGQNKDINNSPVSIDQVILRNIYGDVWKFSAEETLLTNINGSSIDAATLNLNLQMRSSQ